MTAADFAGVTPALSSTATDGPAHGPPDIELDAEHLHRPSRSCSSTRGTTRHITCSVADSAGTVTVPTALLGKFTSGEAGLITLTRTNVTKSTDGNVTVNLVSTVTTGGHGEVPVAAAPRHPSPLADASGPGVKPPVA